MSMASTAVFPSPRTASTAWLCRGPCKGRRLYRPDPDPKRFTPELSVVPRNADRQPRQGYPESPHSNAAWLDRNLRQVRSRHAR